MSQDYNVAPMSPPVSIDSRNPLSLNRSKVKEHLADFAAKKLRSRVGHASEH